MVDSVFDKERMIRLNISLDKIAEELARMNQLKEKELEFIKYQSEIMLKEYELNFQKKFVEEEIDNGYSTNAHYDK